MDKTLSDTRLAKPFMPMPKQKLFGSLSLRIMLMFVGIIGIVLASVILLISITLRLYLTDEVDKSLISSGKIVANQTLERLVNDSGVQVIPSDFYFYINLDYHTPIEVVQANVNSLYGSPAHPESIVRDLAKKSSGPFTVPGTQATIPWRVLIVDLQYPPSGLSSGKVLIALPLGTVNSTVNNVVQVMIALAIVIVLLGGFLSYLMVQHALKGVRAIEQVTHQVAAGNLASRVPAIAPDTEMGALSVSINTMLANIEHAFAVQQASEQKMRQFVSDASHELRTPLATVRGYAELYRMGGVPSEQMNHAFERIESESTRMGNLVEDLLKLARLDEGRGLRFSPVDLTLVATNAVEDFLVRAPERKASVTDLDGNDPEPLTITADSDKITQVITNLLSNVLTHTPPEAPVDVEVGINPENPEEAIVHVRDHGPGVKPEDAKRLFERFYRTDSSRSRDTGGSGLGLAIVAATVAAHGGKARVSETPGGGLTVTLTLPITPLSRDKQHEL